MFGNLKKIAELEAEVAHLKRTNEQLLESLTQFQSNKYTNEIDKECDECSFAFDLSMAISVERVRIGKSDEHTIIGYIDTAEGNKGDVAEWHFECSREMHNDFAERFEEYLKMKHNKTYTYSLPTPTFDPTKPILVPYCQQISTTYTADVPGTTASCIESNKV